MQVRKNIILDSSRSNKEYVSDFNLSASVDDLITFEAEGSDFEVLIHNMDRFFDSDEEVLRHRIKSGNEKEIEELNAELTAGTEKYYSVYCFNNNDFANKIGESPPRIIIDF